jgi:hypothetical protein
MISLSQAKLWQDELQAEGQKLLQYLDIESRLASLGQVRVEDTIDRRSCP